jgi:DEAD/DEAH box helicase
MSPTRELAIQTHDTLLALGEPFGITSVAVFGGVDKSGQIKALKDKAAKIVVGTPGRIMDLVNDGACDLSRPVDSSGSWFLTDQLFLTVYHTWFWTKPIECSTRVSRMIFGLS